MTQLEPHAPCCQNHPTTRNIWLQNRNTVALRHAALCLIQKSFCSVIQRFVMFYPDCNFHFDILHLCIPKNVLFLIAVEIDSNCCPIETAPTESVDDSRTIREDYPQPLRWKPPFSVCKNSWETRAHTLCICIHWKSVITKNTPHCVSCTWFLEMVPSTGSAYSKLSALSTW